MYKLIRASEHPASRLLRVSRPLRQQRSAFTPLYDCYTHTGDAAIDSKPVTDDYGPPIDIRDTLLRRH